jgi:DNA repair protein RecO (recombination protein O)
VSARGEVTDAVVLRRVPWGDADLVLHLLTRDFGRVSAFARSARGSKRRFRGGLDGFAAVRVTLLPRAEGLWSLVEAEALDTWTGIGGDPARAAGVATIAELLDAALAERQGDADLFDRVVRFLAWAAAPDRSAERLATGVHRMMLVLLQEHGTLPDFARSARSGVPFASSERRVLVPDVGVVSEPEALAAERGISISAEVAEYLAEVVAGRFPSVERPVRHEAGEALHALWQRILQRELKAWLVWRELRGLV